jgi:Tfp pilus assembly protein PilV
MHEGGFTLVEALVAMGTGSVLAAASASLLAVSGSAVSQGELQSTATFVAQRTIEQWRVAPASAPAGTVQLDRWGDVVETSGVFRLEWQSVDRGAGQWQVTARVSSARLPSPVTVRALLRRGAP